ncbi:unnamed protein product [Symbiodinium natans]|uniref:Uncharacterized protein n=1 Tax=Symbiodinium natans TaxID=878477 RepID=A0A812UW87_9DINO|nr:unnamed protein product [Symbiodinium natans]
MDFIPGLSKVLDEDDFPESAALVAEIFRGNLTNCEQVPEELVEAFGNQMVRTKRAGRYVPWYTFFLSSIVAVGSQGVSRNQNLVIECLQKHNGKNLMNAGLMLDRVRQLIQSFTSTEMLKRPSPDGWRPQDGELAYYASCLDLLVGIAKGRSNNLVNKPFVSDIFSSIHALALLCKVQSVEDVTPVAVVTRHLRTRWLHLLQLLLYDVDKTLYDTSLMSSPAHFEFLEKLLTSMEALLSLGPVPNTPRTVDLPELSAGALNSSIADMMTHILMLRRWDLDMSSWKIHSWRLPTGTRFDLGAMAGIQFPANEKGDRSEKDWRHQQLGQHLNTLDMYYAHLDNLIECTLRTQDATVLQDVLKKGLEKERRKLCMLLQARAMEFECADGKIVPLSQAMAAPSVYREVVLPRPTMLCRMMEGFLVERSLTRSDKWAGYGTMEPDCAAAIKAGATVAAVATRRPKRWADLIAFARKSGGKLLVPVLGDQTANDEDLAAVAGADLLAEAPAVVDWLRRVAKDAPGKVGSAADACMHGYVQILHLPAVTLGTYLYADGEANAPGRHGLDVRLTVASDYAVEALKSLGTDKVSFAYLASCGTSTAIPAEVTQIVFVARGMPLRIS